VNQTLQIAVSLGPVVAFLCALLFLDSFKLVPLAAVVRSVLIGGAAAGLFVLLSGLLLDWARPGDLPYSRYYAPILEETAKAAWTAYLIRTHRVGFLVDAAIHGFAIGTGFALVENVYYLQAMEAGIWVWIVRGFGTAMLHGSTMVVFALLAKGIVDRRTIAGPLAYVPGWLAAVGLHSLYNHFLLPPLVAAAAIFVGLPVVVVLVFERSERATRHWLGVGFDADLEILESIETGQIREGPIGTYLESLKRRFPGTVVADMLCMLQIHHELAIRAKGMLIAREAGFDVPVGPRVRARLEELRYLERSIGRTGRLALRPVLALGGRDAWQRRILGA